MRYVDRRHAGRLLAIAVVEAGGVVDPVVVLGIARGGVPVAAEVAIVLEADLDVAVARKIGAPGNPEYAIGAIAEFGRPILNESVISVHQIPERYVADAIESAEAEVQRRSAAYRGNRPPPEFRGKTVIVIDDGVATGSTLVAVLRAVRAAGAPRIICAVPVGPGKTVARLRSEADHVVCPSQPRSFTAVGGWYDNFDQVRDDEVVGLLRTSSGSPIA